MQDLKLEVVVLRVSGPTHHWSDWYAVCTHVRERGSTPEEAALQAPRHIEGGPQ